MKKKGVLWAVLALLVVAAGFYFFFHGRTYVFTFSEAQLQEQIGKRLPLTKTYFLIIQITLDHPRVALVEHTNHVKAGLDVQLNIHVGREEKALGGSVDVSGGVKYVPGKGQLFLTDPVIEQFSVQGVPEKLTAKVNDALTKFLGEYYAAHPLYTLRATDTKQALTRLLLREVIVRDKTLVVTLGL